MATYPSGVVVFPSRVDGQTIYAAHMNLIQDEVAAIEQALLTGFAHPVVLQKSWRLTGELTPPQITANVNDYAPTGLADAATLRLSTDASRQITGLAAQPSGTMVLLQNVGSFDLVVAHENASSAAANRIICPSGTNLTLTANNSLLLVYDSTSGRWRSTASTAAPTTLPGAWTSFTPTWTSTGGTVPAIGNGTLAGKYVRFGKTVFFQIELVGGSTTVWGSGGNSWRFTLPGGAAASGWVGQMVAGWGWAQDVGTANFVDSAFLFSTTLLGILTHGGALQWSNSSPFTWVNGDYFHIMGFYEEA